jgi:SPP1 gp7 family putative phage head morphogenesis protein
MIQAVFDKPFDEQMEYFRQKGYIFSPDSWRDVWQQAHSRAFTVAQVTTIDVLMDIRSAIDNAVETGITMKQFKQSLKDILIARGWYAPKDEKATIGMPDGTVRKRLTGWRLDNIFQTNLGAAYQVGRYKQMKEVGGSRPYWQYRSQDDPAVRPAHRDHDGKVFHMDHPFWDRWYPPNGFRCRCYVKSLSKRQLDQRGLVPESRDVDTDPDEGWDYNVGKSGLDSWKPDALENNPMAENSPAGKSGE